VTPLERREECTWKEDEGLKGILKIEMKTHTDPLKIPREGMKTLQ